jgi:tetratricopeptide (TPR) repeat protein
MNHFASDPPRWKDGSGQANLSERIAGRLIRDMGAPPVFAQPHLAQIQLRPALLRWWPAVAITLLASGATFALAARLDLVPRWLRPAPVSPTPAVRSHEPPRSSPAAPRVAQSADMEATPSIQTANEVANKPTPTPSLAFVERPRSEAHRRSPESAIPQSPVEPMPTAAASLPARSEEARWLAESIRSLRTDHKPEVALALLDRHAAALDQSPLVHEAMLLRVEALLALKRSDEALSLLDRKSLSNVAASRTLLLARAELRAAAGRCADSLADFDLVLSRAQQRDEQALYGRAVCRTRIGDKPGAHADFERYQRHFPKGPHILDVEKQLAAVAKSASP